MLHRFAHDAVCWPVSSLARYGTIVRLLALWTPQRPYRTQPATFYSNYLLPRVGHFQRPDTSSSILQSHQGYLKRLMLFTIVIIKLSKLSQNADGDEREGRLQTWLTFLKQSPERMLWKHRPKETENLQLWTQTRVSRLWHGLPCAIKKIQNKNQWRESQLEKPRKLLK